MGLMLFSTLVDYLSGIAIHGLFGVVQKSGLTPLPENTTRSTSQKMFLILSLSSNLSLLAFFKYFNFFIDSYNGLVNILGFDNIILDVSFRITLPLGISFYTFQSMSYTIDLYRGKVKVMRSFIDFACFVSLFPQLVAGPILRFADVVEQLKHRKQSIQMYVRGASFLIIGLAKKILIANFCGKIADLAFETSPVFFADAWFGIAAYAFQIFFDFSGYSDMAIGLGLMLGFVFPKNFDSPYRSKSISEFWGRWHLSLSYWLRDYLYIPLGGNKKGPNRTYINIATVMLLGGLWHGASWNFVAWGLIHAFLLIVERMRGKRPIYHNLPEPLRMAITFILILVTWVFFRADSLHDAIVYCGSLFGLTAYVSNALLIGTRLYNPLNIFIMAIAVLCTWFIPQTWRLTKKLTTLKILIIIVVFVLSIIVMTHQSYNPFIYFIF